MRSWTLCQKGAPSAFSGGGKMGSKCTGDLWQGIYEGSPSGPALVSTPPVFLFCLLVRWFREPTLKGPKRLFGIDGTDESPVGAGQRGNRDSCPELGSTPTEFPGRKRGEGP